MNRKLTIVLLLLTVVALAGVPQASAFPGETRACNGCHTLSPSISVTTNVTSITVSPGQNFTVGINWSGGLAGTAGTTEVNWPTTFSNIGITRDNSNFTPTPRVPAPSPAGASGTTQSTLTAPTVPGNYIVRVYTSSGLSPNPDGTNFSDINVTVATPSVNGTISGTVTNASSGLAISGANVTANGITATTNATGNYNISIVAGTYTVTASATGYQSNTTTGVVVTLGNVTTQNFALTLAPKAVATFNISGFKLNSATGSGIPGWNITLKNTTMQTSMLTGADGSYKFMNLVNGTYNVTEELQAGWTNVSPTLQQVTINGADKININFTNQPPTKAFNISGFKINDTNGNGVWNPGEIGIENWNIKLFNNSGTPIASTSTNSQGFYQFTNLTPDRYNVTEEMKLGFTPTNATTKAIIVENMDVMNVNFTNMPTKNGSISGTVTNASSGLAISGANVTANGITATTNATGNYSISIAAGTYTVTASATGYQSNTTTGVVVTLGNVTTQNFALTPIRTFNISGFKINDTNGNGVWDSGEMGIPNWKIMLLNDTGVQLANTSTNAQGFYQFMNIFPGKYNIAEELKTGFTPTNATSIPVTVENMDVMNVNFTNQVTPQVGTFNISGFKINGATGSGIPGWNITITNTTMQKSMLTGADGSYKFTGLANGTYNVSEEMKLGFTPVGATFRVITIENMDVMNVNFTNTPVTKLGSISGTKFNDSDGNGIRESNEAGLPNWTIVLKDSTGATVATATTDANGNYSFTNLSAGNYTVGEVLKPNWTQTAPKPVPPGTYTVTLAAGQDVTGKDFGNMLVSKLGSISGNVINVATGMGVPNVTVRLVGIVGMGVDTKTIRMETMTDSTGMWMFENLPAGRYIIIEQLPKGFIPVNPPVMNIMLAKGQNSMNNNFKVNPISALTPSVPLPPPVRTS